MTDNLRKIEQEVEIARSRLKRDLSSLGSAHTYRDELSSTFSSLVENLKARAAANPAAALAIGAGLAWRFVQRPPIATALVGAGLLSLVRTTPRESLPFEHRDYAGEGRERLMEQAGMVATEVRDRAIDMANATSRQASAAAETVQHVAGNVASAVREQVSSAKESTSDAIQQASNWAQDASDQAGRTIQKAARSIDDTDTRNTILLGAAAVAVATALGIAFQRSTSP